MKNKKRRILEILLVIAALCVVAFVLVRHTPPIVEVIRNGDINDVEAYIQSKGKEGVIILIILQTIETISIFLPALPIYICAGAILGKVKGFLVCWITNIVLNIIIFEVAKKMKVSASRFLDDDEKDNKLIKMMMAAKYPNRLVILMSLIPVFPNGLIPYVAAQTSISLSSFVKSLAIGCLPTILIYAWGGDLLTSEHFTITLPIVILVAALVGCIYLFRDRITKAAEPLIRRFLGIEDEKQLP